MPEWNGNDRRECSRKNSLIGVNIVEINGTVLPFKYDEEMGHNISESGICLEMTKPLSIDDKVRLQIMISEDSQLFYACGKVVWVDSYRREEQIIDGIRIPARDNYKTGINFTGIDDTGKLEINKFLKTT